MTATNHALLGSLVALSIDEPLLALPLAFLSHFLLDFLPHFGYPGSNFKDVLKHKLGLGVSVVDIFGLIFVVSIIAGQPYIVWICALLAISPDFVWVWRYLFFERKGKTPPKELFSNFHEKIQWGERSWGIIIELIVFVVLSATLINQIN